MTRPNPERVESFCHEYIKDFKPGAAARRAGVSPGNASQWACSTLRRPEVQERIAQLKAERSKRVQIEADDVLRPLAQIAFTDINEVVEFRRTCCRHCWGLEFGYQRTGREMHMAQVNHERARKRAEKEGRSEDVGEFDPEGGTGYDATRDPNAECPECHGEGVGMPFIKDTRELGAASAAFAGVKVTKEGIEVKLQDRMRALELLGKHLGMFADHMNLKGELTVTTLAERMRNRKAPPATGVEDLV